MKSWHRGLGFRGIVHLDDLDIKQAYCTIHCERGGRSGCCGDPVSHFYVAYADVALDSKGSVVMPRCEHHNGIYDDNWTEISREDLETLKMMEEIMNE